MKRVCFVLLFFVAQVTLANGAVLYLCIDDSGRKIITDTPPPDAKCESRLKNNESTPRKGQGTDVDLYPRETADGPLPRSEVRDSLGYTYYTADADPTRSLLSILNASTPIRRNGNLFHGHTDWRVKWDLQWFEKPDGRCKIIKVTTEITGNITLPRLVGANPRHQSQFGRYLSALRVHELGHYDIGKEAATEIGRNILSLPEMSSCKDLESAANDLGYRTLHEYQKKTVRYDDSTAYGKLQGAWLDR